MGIMVRDRPAQESALMEPRCCNFLHSGALQPEPEQLPSGWEKCLDLKSGLIYFKDWNSGTMTYRDPRQRMRRTTVWMESATATETTTPSTTASLQITTDDEEQSLELSLNLPGSSKTATALKSPSPTSQEESVCTMEKVRLALDRLTNKKRSMVSGSSRESNSPSTTTTTSNSDECCFTSPSAMSYEGDDEDDEPEVQQAPKKAAPKVVAVAVPELVMGIVGCKSCLMYVMLSKSHPCCPKCGNTDVLLELPEAKPVSKKQRTQLESSSPPTTTTWSWCTA